MFLVNYRTTKNAVFLQGKKAPLNIHKNAAQPSISDQMLFLHH